jgi:NADH:ubiquinone oxidoreductase subunit E
MKTMKTMKTDDPGLAKDEPPPLPSNSELLSWYIDRIHRYVEESPQMNSVPMLHKAHTVAMLMQAQALQEIAEVLKAGELLDTVTGYLGRMEDTLAEFIRRQG